MPRTRPLQLLAAVLALLVSGAAVVADDEAAPLRIVCTTGMIADAARAVAGDAAEVESLMGPGVDPHLYQPTRDDIRALLGADVVLANGLMLEGKMSDALDRLARSGARVHAVVESVDPDLLLDAEDAEGHPDPHVWMDPGRWTAVVELVRDRLAEAAPAHATRFETNAASHLAELAELDRYAERALGTVPERSRVLITAHDAFNYFGDRFGFEVLGIQGISTESEAGVLEIERLVDTLVERKIPAVFVETTVADRNIRALIEGARARGWEVAIGGELFSDAMGPPGSYEGTYLGMIDHNATTIARALGGEAPPKGMNGRLAADGS